MKAAILTIRVWSTIPAGLADTKGEVAEIIAPDLEEIASLCDRGYVAGMIARDGYRGAWEIEEEEVA